MQTNCKAVACQDFPVSSAGQNTPKKNHKNMNQTKQNEFNSFYAHGRITELAFINNFTKQNEMGKLTTSHENNYNNRMNGNVSGVINIHGTTIYSFTVST